MLIKKNGCQKQRERNGFSGEIEIEVDCRAKGSDTEWRYPVGIKESAAVYFSEEKRGKTSEHRNACQDCGQIEPLGRKGTGRQNESEFQHRQQRVTDGLPDQVEASMAQPQWIRRMGAVQIDG